MIRFSAPLFVFFSVLFALNASDMLAQTVGVSTSPAYSGNSKAILDLDGSVGTKGLLVPRMTSAQRGNVGSPSTGFTLGLGVAEKGMTIFNTTSNRYEYWDGAGWLAIGTGTGNASTLDEAYDGGGAGLGRTITADAGNVAIQGAGSLTVAANVGIGTAAPAEKLELEFSGRGGILLDGDNTQDAFIQFENGGSSNYIYADQSDNNNLKLEAGTGKNVNILTDGANERMVVQSDGRVRVNNLADVNGAVVTSNPAGVLGKTPLTGNATDVLLGTGVFGPASALEEDDWYESTTTVAPNSINDNIYKLGTVAIGANITASAPLQVQAVGSGNPANNSILANNPTNSAGQDAIITARVGGSSAGDPFFSLDINGEAGWALGVDNDHANRFKIAPSWNNLSASTAMTIKTDGNVGVATDDPDQKLQVNGVIRSRGAGMIDIDAVNGAGPRVAWGTTTNVYDYMNMGAYNGMNQIETTTRDFRIGSNAATNAIYVQNATGNVGMGTSTPDANLNVGNPDGATIYLTREDNTTATNDILGSLLFDSTDDTSPSTTDASAGIRAFASQDHGNSNKGGYLTFITKNNVGLAASATERMRIQADGNIGVGTTAPGSIFHVSTTQAGNVSKLHNPTLANGSLVGHEFGKANSTNNMVEFRYNHASDGNSANYVNLGLWGSANTLTVAGTGNVGVGTTSAAQKLHVVGNTRISGLASAERLVYANASGDLIASTSAVNANSLVDGAGTLNYLARWTPDGNSLGNGATQDNGTDVGIGVAPGTFKLNVNGTTQSSTYFVNHGSGNVLEIGDDAWLGDINGANFAGIYGQSNAAHGGLRLGNNGGATLYSDGSANIGVGTLVPTHKLHVNGDIWAEGRFVVQNGTNGGTARGIRMWTATDSNWGIYMGQSGGGLSMSGGTAVAGGGFTSHAIRFRVNNSSTNGFIFENSSESNLFSIRGDNGRATFRGGVLFDCPDCGSTSTVDGNADWGDLIIQGRVVSTNSNLHLSPPNGSKVIINTTYRAAGGATGNSGLDIEDGGLRMRKTYRWINRYGSTGGYGWGAQTHDLGNWDFCAVGHFGFRNTNSTTDEDDDVQCAVYPQAHAGPGEGDQWDSNFTYQFNARPRWYMYLEGYADTNATNCAASCMNFE